MPQNNISWTDRYIRNPANEFVDKYLRKPVQKNFVQPMQQQFVPNMQKAVEGSKEQLRGAANVVGIPGHITSEFRKGYNGYYRPETLDSLDSLRFAGMVRAGMDDRYNHDYSTNADGTPNTNPPTFFSTLSDVGRNVWRNLALDSDMPGTTRLPVVGETKNSTIANVGALPSSVAMYASVLPKSWTSKVIPNAIKKPVPIANMSNSDKFRLYEKLQHEKAKAFKRWYSPKGAQEAYSKLTQDPRNPISFNTFLNTYRKQNNARYAAEMDRLSGMQEELFPWLRGKVNAKTGLPSRDRIRTGTLSHRTPSNEIDRYGAWLDRPYYGRPGKFPADPNAVMMRHIKREGLPALRAVIRTKRDNHWNTPSEQAQSLVSDLTGDVAGSAVATYGPLMLATAGGAVLPTAKPALDRAAPLLSRALDAYIIGSNQISVARNAMGLDEPKVFKYPDIRSWSADKVRKTIDASKGALNSLREDISNIQPNIQRLIEGWFPNEEDAKQQGVFIPGTLGPTVQ